MVFRQGNSCVYLHVSFLVDPQSSDVNMYRCQLSFCAIVFSSLRVWWICEMSAKATSILFFCLYFVNEGPFLSDALSPCFWALHGCAGLLPDAILPLWWFEPRLSSLVPLSGFVA